MDGIPRHFGGCVGCQRSIRGSLSCQVARRSKFKGTGIMTEAAWRGVKKYHTVGRGNGVEYTNKKAAKQKPIVPMQSAKSKHSTLNAEVQ